MSKEQLINDYTWASEVEDFDHIDKGRWPPGEWNNEPDKVVWTDAQVCPFPMMIVRNNVGSLCGYVGVPEGHRLFGLGYFDAAVPEEMHNACPGGLTYANKCAGPICHAGTDHVWWFGFDCAQSWDVCPGYSSKFNLEHATYKTMQYVKSHVESLAKATPL